MLQFFTQEKIQYYYERYERRVSSAAFLFGFIMDNLTLKRIDLLFENIVLFSYIIIASVSISVMNFWEGGKLRGRFFEIIVPWLPLVMQFAFGGLFSGFVVFYARSASFVISWPFILMLAVLLIGNEFFRKHYQQFTFQISMLFIALFSFFIFFLPVVFKTFGAETFILSGIVSVIGIGMLVRFLQRAQFVSTRKRHVVRYSIVSIYIGMHVLYFTNIIPPIPLALKEVGIYYSVERTFDGYHLQGNDRPWYAFLQITETIHTVPFDSLSLYSAVFAPTKLTTDIVHEWQYFDEDKDIWITRSRVQFPITGGRDGGYRGYSVKSRVEEGRWRVNVETARGQLLGRKIFQVVY
jgi:hypothetical protein